MAESKYVVYILKSDSNKLYIGQTTNIQRRIRDHINHRGADFFKIHRIKSLKLVHKEEFPTLKEAMNREKQLKGWTRAKKEALIAGDLGLLKKL